MNIGDIFLWIGCGVVVGLIAMFIANNIMSKSRAKRIIEEAQLEAEVIKKNKILEAKEEEMKIKSEAEKNANARMSKIQSSESRIKQREMQ